jgi:hypothetical protein
MDPAQVQRLVGTPTSVRPFITGKAFIPWYFGPARTRTAFYYKGQGRVILSGDPVNAQSSDNEEVTMIAKERSPPR